MSDSLPRAREVQLGHDGRLYELDGTPLNVPGLGDEATRQSLTDARVRQGMTPPAAAGAGFVSPPVVACEDVDLESVEMDALTHYYVSGGTVLGLVEVCRERGAEVERLRAAIREHKDERGDDRCWLSDEALYRAAGLGEVGRGETALPPKCDFLASCERFWRQRQAPLEHGNARLPGGMTIAQLGEEVERLKARCEFAVGKWMEAAATLRGNNPHGYGRATADAEAQVSAALAGWDRGHPAGVARAEPDPKPAPSDLESAIRDAVDDLPHRAEIMIHVSRDGAEARWRTDAEWHEAESDGGLAAEVREAVERCKHGPKEEDDVPAPAPAPSWPDRLRFDHDVSHDSPVVAGTRVTAAEVVWLITKDGKSWSDVLWMHPELTEDDIRACLAYTIEHEDDATERREDGNA